MGSAGLHISCGSCSEADRKECLASENNWRNGPVNCSKPVAPMSQVQPMTAATSETIGTDDVCRLHGANMVLDHFGTRIEQVDVPDLLDWDDSRGATAPHFQSDLESKRQTEDWVHWVQKRG